MDETGWLDATDPKVMLTSLTAAGKGSGRKLRLFAVACCRRIWDTLWDPRSRAAVEAAERFADGLASEEELELAWEPAWEAVGFPRRHPSDGVERPNALAASSAATPDAQEAATCTAWDAAWDAASHRPRHAEQLGQAALLRDIFGNPFRPALISRAWLTPTVTALATAAYQERLPPSGALDGARLAVMADALEEAGCTNAELLGHLRGPGPHVRGCWAVDAVLGRE
jgi:hypothetical protein